MQHIIHNSSLLYFTLFYCLYHLSSTISTWHFAISITMGFELNSRLFVIKETGHANMCFFIATSYQPTPKYYYALVAHWAHRIYVRTHNDSLFACENVKTKRTSIISYHFQMIEIGEGEKQRHCNKQLSGKFDELSIRAPTQVRR